MSLYVQLHACCHVKSGVEACCHGRSDTQGQVSRQASNSAIFQLSIHLFLPLGFYVS